MSPSNMAQAEKADRRFIREAMRLPILSRERERELALRWRDQGDEAALHELISAYVRLVVATATRFRHYGLPLGDLVQEGNIGLLLAAARFEPEREVRFSTYATWWIRSSIQDYVLRNWSIVRTGSTAMQKALFFNLRRLRAQIDVSGEHLPHEARQRIADLLKVEVSEVESMEVRLAANDRSLNLPVGEDGDSELMDHLPDETPDPEALVAEHHDSALRARWIAEAVSNLSEREQTIIRARRLSDDAVTLESLGKRLGISKERVRQIEHQAIQKLRAFLEPHREALI
jgi:RNA polymerase sigma-32 factor